MEPWWQSGPVTVYHGDCVDVIRTLPDASVDAVVTDPPYALNFMGHGWDRFTPGEFQHWCQGWAAECLRVLKPGGHLLAFGGTRTWHRLAAGVEDAGFEVRDSIAWLYGQGFSKTGLLGNKAGVRWCDCADAVPYNHANDVDVSGLWDDVYASPFARGEGEDAELLAPLQREAAGGRAGEALPRGKGGVVGRGRGVVPREDVRRPEPGLEGRDVPRAGEGVPDGSAARAPAREGKRVRRGTPAGDGGAPGAAGAAAGGGAPRQSRQGRQHDREPAVVPGPLDALDDGALRGRAACPRCGGLDPAFRGFSTSLKPAFEPVVVARKPLARTVAANVLAHGTGALNVDACRIAVPDSAEYAAKGASVVGLTSNRNGDAYGEWKGERTDSTSAAGRWPANVVLDASQAAALDRQSGQQVDGTTVNRNKTLGEKQPGVVGHGANSRVSTLNDVTYGGSGGASRFFYTAKASTAERPRGDDGGAHPTVKPVDLMRWLVRLVTPPGGVVLEPFAGSGSTVEAAVLEGFRCVAVEREATYLPLIRRRLGKPHEVGLFEADPGGVEL